MAGQDVERTVSRMLAFAFNHHRGGISDSPTLLREAFVEACITYACRSTSQGQLLIDALRPDEEPCTFRSMSSQVTDGLIPGGRPDLGIDYSINSSGTRGRVLVELKLDAPLTGAQRQAGYALRYLCPTRRAAELTEELRDSGATVVSWTGLLEAMRKAVSSSEEELLLWDMICSLGEELGESESLFAAPAVLFDEIVAGQYGTALTLMGEIIKKLGHKPLVPPKHGLGANHREIGFGSRNKASLLFTPAFADFPITVRYDDVSENRQKWFWSIREIGASQSYSDSGKTVRLAIEDAREVLDTVHFEEDLLQLAWDQRAADAGEYLSDFLFQVRSVAKESSDVVLTQVALTNQNVGYILQHGDVEFYALFDARCWLRSPKRGPFVMYDNADTPVSEAFYILTGSETTYDDVRKSIQDTLRSTLGLPAAGSVQRNGR